MEKIIELLIKEGYNYHKKASKINNVKTYAMTYNSIRHWAEIGDTKMNMYSVPEGTDGETCLMDTGVLNNPSIDIVKSIIQKAKELM